MGRSRGCFRIYRFVELINTSRRLKSGLEPNGLKDGLRRPDEGRA